MLRTYGPGCDGSIIEPSSRLIPEGATWVDLEQPTREEEELVERCIGLNVPTQEEMAEIEPSSRLFERNGALYMTLSALSGVADGQPTTTPVTFLFTGKRLVTVRYGSPKPFTAFAEQIGREPELARDASTVLIRLLDAIIDRLADELEGIGADIEAISNQIFRKEPDERRIPAARLNALLTRIGRAQSLLAKIRYSTVSSNRLLSFLAGSPWMEETGHESTRHHVRNLNTDVSSLIDHSGFLGDNLTFLLNASLGFISIEQNAAMKLFSWAAIIFLPPTLVAGIYGMNFEHMPELKWLLGYPMALGLIFFSAVLPLWYFKFRRLI